MEPFLLKKSLWIQPNSLKYPMKILKMTQRVLQANVSQSLVKFYK